MSLFSRKAYDKLITMSGKKGGVPMLVGELIDVRAFFCQGGGGEPFAQKNSHKLPKFLRNSRKETRVIRCTNNGLHMK